MRRAPIVLTATAAGTAALLSFHPHGPAVATTTAATPAASASSGSTSSGSTSSGSTSTTSSSGTKTYDGTVEQTQYGPVQVRISVRNGKVVEVTALQLPANDPRSSQISSYAAPLLRQEALQAQSANVDAVSGASFTSAGYLASLASAFSQAGL